MVKELNYNIIVYKGGVNMIKENTELISFESKLTDLINSMSNMSEQIKILSSEQKLCDQELIDLEHYAEFLDFNDSEGLVIAKEIKKVVTRRREIKDSLSLIESLYGSFSSKIGGAKAIEEMISKKESQKSRLEERKYNPRVRVDLFEKLKR